MITRYGLEGGAIYALGDELRAMASPEIRIDLKPDSTVEQLIAKMGPIQRNFIAEAGRRWKLPDAAVAVIRFCCGSREISSAREMAEYAKSVPVLLTRPRPIAEAISSAGGVRWRELGEDLMLQKAPGVFVAGEMIDWEAPTGGYLMQGCFASGTRAGEKALAWGRRNAAD
jgi:predicted flavoprotein YhiN